MYQSLRITKSLLSWYTYCDQHSITTLFVVNQNPGIMIFAAMVITMFLIPPLLLYYCSSKEKQCWQVYRLLLPEKLVKVKKRDNIFDLPQLEPKTKKQYLGYFQEVLADVGLLEFLLCGARTPALQKLIHTHFRTALQFLMIAPAPALFQKECNLSSLFQIQIFSI